MWGHRRLGQQPGLERRPEVRERWPLVLCAHKSEVIRAIWRAGSALRPQPEVNRAIALKDSPCLLHEPRLHGP